MDNEARILLDDVIAFCRRDGRETRLINMLEQCGATGFDDESLTIQVPSRFAYNYLVKQRELIERYLEEISFMPMVLNVVVAEGGAPSETQTPAAAATPTVPVTAAAASLAPAGDGLPQRAAEVPTSFAEAPAGPIAPAEPVATSEPTVAAPAKSEPISKSGVTVRNTVSPEAFRKMMDEMRSQDPTGKRQNVTAPQQPAATHAPVAAVPAATPEPDAAALDINAKYTFASFVAGDENRHAFNSAMRFAAYAEEPQQCPSLFIYGNSGLGKTHLLFAIRNYLAKEKPYIRVKYANSQAYLDDYMNELGAQRGPGNLIMREYRDADILIIDDVQNIVGKQASVEFFFQLVDSFIREGKKIALASDRAPKDLAMDERLTSRFSSGMLCLVSEPGFEMKYVILKRYYESIIQQDEDLTSMNVDTSLLQALPSSEGKLTDEHLRHMAEISGNNIRSLESFCERCANLSSEREAAGAELTAEDIDRVAKIYFNTAHKIIHVDTVQRVVEEFYHVSHEELVGKRRTANIAFARHVAVYLANNLCEMTTPAIGAEFGGRDHSTVLNSLKVVENKMREDRRIVEDVQNLKNTILLKS
ncbi:DnaA ATPase domain-containing protein [Collinsella intestinalis]|uniref:DnaA ATPase domain-containing protein n=1 Tax=Collinsella intestinalis TaxID=147207 RepID=UPI002673AB60|nr:DnaA/Hda family protein [Collinsella intestinalis]